MTKKECIRYLDGVKDHRICLACWALELRKFLTVTELNSLLQISRDCRCEESEIEEDCGKSL